MKTKFTMMLTLFMALIVQISFAQQKTVSGFQTLVLICLTLLERPL